MLQIRTGDCGCSLPFVAYSLQLKQHRVVLADGLHHHHHAKLKACAEVFDGHGIDDIVVTGNQFVKAFAGFPEAE